MRKGCEYGVNSSLILWLTLTIQMGEEFIVLSCFDQLDAKMKSVKQMAKLLRAFH